MDLDRFYPPAGGHPNTVFKSMAIAFQAMGDTTTYLDLMGLSAAAFRLQVGGALCPSSPHPHLGYSCAALAREALGYAFVEHPWAPGEADNEKRVRRAVVESIERGAPVLTAEEETGLVVGYVGDGESLLIRPPYSKRGDPPDVVPNPDVWGFGAVETLPKPAGTREVIRSLEVAAELAHMLELQPGGYASGFAAYETWISHLRDPSLAEGAELPAEAIILGNAHIYYCLSDARRCASEYSAVWKDRFPDRVRGRLGEVAELYGQVHELLEAGWGYVPWPRELRQASEWTQERRGGQAAVLEEVLAMERQAISGIEGALQALD
jgi:hypothetical protein